MLDTILVNSLEQSTQKIIDLLNQLTQDYQQLLQQDKTLLLETFPPNDQTLSILEEIDLLTTDLRGYASQISINQQIQNPDQALTILRSMCLLENQFLAELYFTKNKQFPLFYQYLQKLDYLKLLLIDWLILQR
ncbi:MAG: hypothetical protein KA717_24115 [Woronichinia naegeliana WA131]|jgi:hypothetical protein|uniref:Uncharacterized protein n=1 Tax=Woronichinia naegeliana WA131 TaxID=2824559 RepID=A0A977KSM2_9CYAN|nr:MAG: hypothetical protein KA717_24115 [Woronichinia naegeliana WA131]